MSNNAQDEMEDGSQENGNYKLTNFVCSDTDADSDTNKGTTLTSRLLTKLKQIGQDISRKRSFLVTCRFHAKSRNQRIVSVGDMNRMICIDL
mgnify:CR=1 FL=1